MAEIREQALAAWNEVKMLDDAEAKADCMKKLMELVLEQEDPSLLLPEFVARLLEFRDDPGRPVRENVAECVLSLTFFFAIVLFRRVASVEVHVTCL